MKEVGFDRAACRQAGFSHASLMRDFGLGVGDAPPPPQSVKGGGGGGGDGAIALPAKGSAAAAAEPAKGDSSGAAAPAKAAKAAAPRSRSPPLMRIAPSAAARLAKAKAAPEPPLFTFGRRAGQL